MPPPTSSPDGSGPPARLPRQPQPPFESQPVESQPAESQPQAEPGPLGLRTRKRAYFIMMGVCLVLIVLAWMVIYRYSIVAAVIMSVIALVIPPFAAIVGNAGPANRQ